MAIIRVEELVKEFRRPKRKTGFLGGVRTLLTREHTVTRAVDRVSFTVEPGERGDLAAALIHDPEILYLDEPTVGLDVVAKERIRGFVKELNREAGTTVVLTTHDLGDVERLCHRIVLIDRGRVLYDGDVATLKARYAPYRELVVQTDAETVEVPGATQVRREEGKVWLRFDPERIQPADLVRAVLNVYHATDLSITEPDLEAVIHQLYTSSDSGSGPGSGTGPDSGARVAASR